MYRLFSLLILVVMSPMIWQVVPAWALVNMDHQSIDMALRYGMIHQHQGYQSLLGGNWIEGNDGALLNIYTPFMLLADRAAHGGFATNPTDDDLQKAKKRYALMIRDFTDKERPPQVKFAVSIMGDAPTFAAQTKATLEGYSHGRPVVLTPSRQHRLSAEHVKPSTAVAGKYDAVNSYYFPFPDVADLDQYELVLHPPAPATPIRFHIRNQAIY